jgi:hypothetical protein
MVLVLHLSFLQSTQISWKLTNEIFLASASRMVDEDANYMHLLNFQVWKNKLCVQIMGVYLGKNKTE